MKYLLTFFIPPGYLLNIKKKGPATLNLVFYTISIVCHLLGLLTIIFGIGVFFFLLGFTIWSICVGHAGYYMRQEELARQAELIASKIMRQGTTATPEHVRRLDESTAQRRISEGWHADPFGRFDQRYYDGVEWTEHVYHSGEMKFDRGELKLIGAAESPAPGGNDRSICGGCGTRLESADRFCPECGSEVPQEGSKQYQCVSCGTVSTVPIKFCGECGKPFTETATA